MGYRDNEATLLLAVNFLAIAELNKCMHMEWGPGGPAEPCATCLYILKNL
jgi:hypothetical protein